MLSQLRAGLAQPAGCPLPILSVTRDDSQADAELTPRDGLVGGRDPCRFRQTFGQLMAQDALIALIGQEPPTDTRYRSGVR